MRRTLKIGFWTLLYAAFVLAAVMLRAALAEPENAEILGWDYGLYVRQIQDWSWVAYTGFRHPGLGLVMSPLVALEHLWPLAYLLVMPLVALATAGLVFRLGGWLALALHLLLPGTWLLAGTPESFPVAELGLVASVAFAAWGSSRRALVFAALNAAVTLTNGAKVILAFVVASPRRRDVRRLVVAGAVLAAMGVVFFLVRAQLTGRPCGEGIVKTLSWIPETRRLGRELYGFFLRPMGIAALLVYPLAFGGAVRILRGGSVEERALLKALAAYFAVDALIHLVIGWGMAEPWVFAPHYQWMAVVLAGKCRGRWLGGR